MFTSTGTIQYDDSDRVRMTVKVNQDFSNYYRALIPKYLNVVRPRWPAHITAIRPELDIPPKIRYWGDYDGEEVEFLYDPYIFWDKGFCWVDAWSKRLEDIRTELGLPNTSTRPVVRAGFSKIFHCTIGNYEENLP